MLALLAAVVLGCSSDAQCELMVRCTCECCRVPQAMTKQEAQDERRRCAARGPCAPREGCPEKCPPEEPKVAACRNGACVKVTKGARDGGR